MKELHQYINNMFYALPKSEEVEQIKESITHSMEEKFHALRQEGKTESEAYFIVTSEFGSIEELCQDLSITPEYERSVPKTRVVEQEVTETTTVFDYKVNEKLKEEYDVFRKKFAIWILVGVGVLILAVMSQLLLNDYYKVPEALANCTFLGIAAFGVGICTYWGIEKGRYDEALETEGKLNANDYQAYGEGQSTYTASMADQRASEYVTFRKKYAKWTSVGVVVIILSVMSQHLLEAYFNVEEALANITFLGIVAIGIGLCTYWGIEKGKYEQPKTKEYKRKSQLSDKISTVIMLSATIIFLIAGFIYDGWQIAWIVFPIGGIICGIVDTLLNQD